MPIFNLRNDTADVAASTTASPSATPSSSAGVNASATSSAGTAAASAASAAEESFPEIKGRVESKLMSMWHNVKYGWTGQIRTNFSKEQPVWLLGRCYHPKFSPASSMESSVEMTANMENKLSLADYPPLPSLQRQRAPTVASSNTSASVIVQLPLPGGVCHDEPTSAEYADDAIEVGELASAAAAMVVGTADHLDGGGGGARWEEGIDGFRRDFCSRLWLTYRREFPILNGSNYTSDCGWGCMLRSGQMMLAQAMLCHFLGRAWRWDPESQLHATHEDQIHRRIVRWFGDTPSKNSPFSIHTLVTIGQSAGKRAGDWYGPASVSHLLKKAVKMASQENADFDNLHVYVAQDCTVYIQDILDECLVPDPTVEKRAQAPPWQQQPMVAQASAMSATDASLSSSVGEEPTNLVWKALVLLVPLRLGAEKLNAIYGNCLKTLLSTEHCIGIIGGRPKHSLYFVGFQEDKLIHLDPHYCQEMVDVNQDNFSPHTFHCKSPRKLKLNKMDPSCCIGFYCQTRADFERFVATVQTYLLPVRLSPTTVAGGSSSACASGTNSMTSSLNGCLSAPRQPSADCAYPMFVFSRSRSTDTHVDETRPAAVHQMMMAAAAAEACPDDNDDDGGDETEEFVIL